MRRSDALTALLRADARPHRYEAKRANDNEATIYLYDMIGADPWTGEGVSAVKFVPDLMAIDAPVIHLRINSPGGDVFDGRAMATAIAEHPSKIIAHIDGIAASAASYVALAADEVEFAPGSMMMIHRAWTVAFGNADDLAQTIEVLSKIDESMANDYARQTGNTPAQSLQWMADETWFTAEEALDKGFADRIAGETVSAAAAWYVPIYESGAPTARQLENSLRERGYSRSEARAIVSRRFASQKDDEATQLSEEKSSGTSAPGSGTPPEPQWDAECESLEQAAMAVHKSLHQEALDREVVENEIDGDSEFIEGLKAFEEDLVAIAIQRRWKRLTTS